MRHVATSWSCGIANHRATNDYVSTAVKVFDSLVDPTESCGEEKNSDSQFEAVVGQ